MKPNKIQLQTIFYKLEATKREGELNKRGNLRINNTNPIKTAHSAITLVIRVLWDDKSTRLRILLEHASEVNNYLRYKLRT